MRKYFCMSIILLCLLLVPSACSRTPGETITGEITPGAPQDNNGELQIPDGSQILSLSASGDSIAAIYENGSEYHAAVFHQDGTLANELCQSADFLSARFLDSGKLALWYSDVMELWDVPSNTKDSTFTITEGALPDEDGQSVWNTEEIMKDNEIGVSTSYITKAVRMSADGTQSVLELPDGVTTLLYAEYPYLYYKKEIQDYKIIICKTNVETQETTELSDWVCGTDTPMGHKSVLFQSEILMPWELPDQMFVSNHAQILARDGETLLLQGDDTIRVINANTQMLLAEVPLNGEIIAGSVNEENHYFVLSDSSSATVHQWENEGTATDMAKLVDLTNISGTIQSQREALLSLYNVTISNDATQVAEYFQPKSLESELRSYVAGIELTNFFALLPQGMVDEMLPPTIQTLPVYLTGYMTSVGLSVPYEDPYYLALDVNFLYDSFLFKDSEITASGSAMIDTLPHEFMHMLEFRLNQTTLSNGEPILSLWDAVVPPEEDESFTGTYEGEWDTRNSLESDDPSEEIWFEVAYSRTMPEEDRSTLFACLFSGVHTNGEGWDVYPHLLEKGQLLCAIIREAYPSIKASPEGSMYWERNFTQLPLSSFLTQE